METSFAVKIAKAKLKEWLLDKVCLEPDVIPFEFMMVAAAVDECMGMVLQLDSNLDGVDAAFHFTLEFGGTVDVDTIVILDSEGVRYYRGIIRTIFTELRDEGETENLWITAGETYPDYVEFTADGVVWYGESEESRDMAQVIPASPKTH